MSLLNVGKIALCILSIYPCNARAHDIIVTTAVAPRYPQIGQLAWLSCKVQVIVSFDKNGMILFAKPIKTDSSYPAFLEESEKAAKRWKFEIDKSRKMQQIQITFVYTIMPKDALDEEVTTIFRPPFEMEVRYRPPADSVRPIVDPAGMEIQEGK
jgi:hypothetical protein